MPNSKIAKLLLYFNKCQVKITKEDGTAVPTANFVAPVNNSCLSLFDSCETRINDAQVSHSCGMYNYRSYVQSLISFGDEAKQTNLALGGWFDDQPMFHDDVWDIEPLATNEGMKNRSCWFRKGTREDATKPYSADGFTFLTAFKHDFYGLKGVMPPATKVQFTLTKAADGWYLLRPPGVDKENYRFHIISCNLYVKMVTLTYPVYRSLKARIDKEKLLYQYRRLSMKQDVINDSSIIYESGNLFPDRYGQY